MCLAAIPSLFLRRLLAIIFANVSYTTVTFFLAVLLVANAIPSSQIIDGIVIGNESPSEYTKRQQIISYTQSIQQHTVPCNAYSQTDPKPSNSTDHGNDFIDEGDIAPSILPGDDDNNDFDHVIV